MSLVVGLICVEQVVHLAIQVVFLCLPGNYVYITIAALVACQKILSIESTLLILEDKPFRAKLSRRVASRHIGEMSKFIICNHVLLVLVLISDIPIYATGIIGTITYVEIISSIIILYLSTVPNQIEHEIAEIRRVARQEARQAQQAHFSRDIPSVFWTPDQRDTECAICMNDYDAKSVIHVYHCGHAFHTSCSTAWLYTDPSCPTCRASLRSILPPI